VTSSTSLEERNKEVVRAFFDAGSRGDLERVQELMADDIVIHQASFLPYAGSYTKDRFPDLAATMSQYIQMSKARLVRLVADGEYVFVVLTVPDARTGHDCIQGIQIRLRDGRFAENFIFYHDAGSMAVAAP
jgi:ketosteroid isomerase-like protein